MIRIPLHAHDGSVHAYALVDDADAAVTRWRWSLHDAGYAFRQEKGHGVYLHRQLLGLDHGDRREGDHVNGDRLDNRRANLRTVAHQQNCQNHRRGRGTSRFRGVYFHRRSGKWMARVKVMYRHHYLGVFDDELDAARVAEAYRLEHLPFAQPDPALVALALEPTGAAA